MNEQREIKKKRSNFISRFVVLGVLLLVCLNGCGASFELAEKETTKSMFVKVEDANSWMIVYHRDTKVMYAVSDAMYNRGNFTLLVNADGSPMIWEGE